MKHSEQGLVSGTTTSGAGMDFREQRPSSRPILGSWSRIGELNGNQVPRHVAAGGEGPNFDRSISSRGECGQ